jgi:probable F420-dependent oxidoreductase
LWIPGLDGGAVFDDAERLLASAPHSTVALGVLSIWRQTAEQLARQVSDVTARFPNRLLTGVGVSSPHSAEASGHDYGSPLMSMSRYLDELDAASAPLPDSQRILGALGPKMAELAGSRSAGMHPFLVTAEASVRYREIVGPDPLIAPHLSVVLEADPERARTIARQGIGMFISLPSYQNNLRRLGFTDADTVPGGSDRLIDAVVAWGDLGAIQTRIRQHLDAGADHVALHVLSDTAGPPMAQWRRLADLVPVLA